MFESEYQLPHGFGVFLICTLQKGLNKCIPMVANFHSWNFMDLICLKSICLCLWDCVRNGKRRIPEQLFVGKQLIRGARGQIKAHTL